MAQPGQFNPGAGEDWIGRELAQLKNELRELRSANPFAPMGMKPIPGGVEIQGTLSLPSGIINNDALANPVQIGTASNGVNNYAITTTSTVRASVTLTVPDGFTEAVVMANPTAMGFNGTAGGDYLYVMAVVQTIGGGELYSAAGAGFGAGLAAPFHTTLTGLIAGQTITVGVATRAGFNTWAASTANQANIYATAIFIR